MARRGANEVTYGSEGDVIGMPGDWGTEGWTGNDDVDIGGTQYWRAGRPWQNTAAAPDLEDGQRYDPRYGWVKPTANVQRDAKYNKFDPFTMLPGALIALGTAGMASGALGAGMGAVEGAGLGAGVSAGGLAGELGIAGGLGAGELGAVAAGGGLAGELGSMANYFPGVGTSFPATSSIEQMIAALSNGQGLAVGNLGTTAQAANIGNLASGIGAGAGAAGGGGGGFLNAIQNYFTNPANIASSAASTGLQTALGSGGGGATEDAAGNLYNPSDPSNPIPRTTTASGGNNFLAKMLASSGAGATSQFLKSMGIDISPSALGLLGNIGSTALGVYGANQQSNALTDIANQARADRQPFLQSATDMLNNPDDYYKRPEVTGSVDAILRGLSAKVGNPFGHPAALGQAAAYNLGGYNNALGQRAALGLGGQDTISRLQTNAATGQGNVYNALGSGLGSMLSTQPNINALLSEYLARQI